MRDRLERALDLSKNVLDKRKGIWATARQQPVKTKRSFAYPWRGVLTGISSPVLAGISESGGLY
ncbi:MAG: hypothetical protein DRH17_00715 [Deltaproteobacteria bacterium]|nr:MAG: hypothetical protein DRH17_00715 [Deltaproteobacteria bacterium]